MPMMGYGLGGPWMMALSVVFWVFVVAAVVWLVLVVSRGQGTSTGRSRSSLDVLEERYARGEIDAEEFRTRRGLIEGATR